MHRRGLAAASAALVSLLLAAGPAAAAAPIPTLTIQHPWLRFLTPQIPAAGYFSLDNGTDDPAVLTGAASHECGKIMLHRSIVTNGTATMIMVGQVVVPPHGSVTFRPGGYHLMCMSPSAAVKPGNKVVVSLRFQDGSSLTAQFPVYGASGK